MKFNKKHIAILTSYFPSISETFIVNHITGLVDAGYNLTILARKKQDILKASQPYIIESYNLIDKTLQYLPESPNSHIEKLKDVTLIILRNKSLWTKGSKFLRASSMKRSIWLKKIMLAEAFKKLPEFDFYHAHFGINAIHLATMKQLGVLKAPYGVSFHGFDAHAVDDNTFVLLKEKYKAVFKTAAFVTVNTTYLKEKVLELGCPLSLIHTIPVGVDTNFFEYKKRILKPKLSIISIGRLIPLKGHSYGIQVINQLINRGFDVEYTIIGSGPEYENLKKLVIDLDLENSVHLVLEKSQGEIKKLLYDSDLFLMTSITDIDGRAEAQGLVTLEAQATGIPVVAFNSGGVADTLIDGETGFLVNEKDIQSMVDKVELFIKETTTRNAMGIKANDFVKTNFNNIILAQKMITLYEQFN
ncbi:glycoside hydrolase [Patiriisocius marinistellae]|uniref:Glycoside hydrolase n=1 Tax=Patiriisocius marinistellae TaxID=2494560 RepID=A0A5J4G3A3_9FLAO|nr:glycosyltransferase [Patiriisocius marinistellae]GEQ86811.1 glycoside hydrolase [Patiriisocius marinistellae]